MNGSRFGTSAEQSRGAPLWAQRRCDAARTKSGMPRGLFESFRFARGPSMFQSSVQAVDGLALREPPCYRNRSVTEPRHSEWHHRPVSLPLSMPLLTVTAGRSLPSSARATGQSMRSPTNSRSAGQRSPSSSATAQRSRFRRRRPCRDPSTFIASGRRGFEPSAGTSRPFGVRPRTEAPDRFRLNT